MEHRVEEQVPGRGPVAGVQLQAAEGEVPHGGREAPGHLGRGSGARNLEREEIIRSSLNFVTGLP